MQTDEASTRQSVNLPAHVSRRVRAIAKTKGLSSSKVIADLVESGLAAKEREKERFFELAEQLAKSTSRSQQTRLKAELARLTFGS
jgi:metal-responsive CopG/Arc/MetJ family transcriptional regulator